MILRGAMLVGWLVAVSVPLAGLFLLAYSLGT